MNQPASVGRKAIRGAALMAGASYASVLFGIGARKLIALLLTPTDIGAYQAALSVVDVVMSFAGFSFASAIINVRDNLVDEPLEHLRENVFLLTIGLNAVVATAAMLFSLTLLPRTHGLLLAGIAGVYCVQRVASAIDTFYTQVLERELLYPRIAQVSLVVNILLHSCSVVFALMGGGAWAIPLATIVSTVASLYLDRYFVRKAGLATVQAKPWRYYNPKTVRWLWKFGTKVFFNRLFEGWLFRVDNLWVAYLFGSFYLGYYAQAFSIALLPSVVVSPIVARVSIATYAEVQHDRDLLSRAFELTNFFLIRLLIPAAIFLLVESRDLVRLFLSSDWGPVAEPLAALAGLAVAVPLFENAKMVLGAQLRLKEISFVRIGQLVLVAILFLTIGHGIMLVAICMSIVSIIGYIAILIYLRQSLTFRPSGLFAWPLAIGLFAYLVTALLLEPWMTNLLPAAASLGVAASRLVLIGVGILALTFGAEWLIHPAELRTKVQYVRERWH